MSYKEFITMIENTGMIRRGAKEGYILLNDLQWKAIKKRFENE